MLCKGIAWAVSLGQLPRRTDVSGHLPRCRRRHRGVAPPRDAADAGVAVGMGVMVVAFLKLPLSAIVIATGAHDTGRGRAVGPLIIIGTVVAYLTTLGLEGRLGARASGPDAPSDVPAV